MRRDSATAAARSRRFSLASALARGEGGAAGHGRAEVGKEQITWQPRPSRLLPLTRGRESGGGGGGRRPLDCSGTAGGTPLGGRVEAGAVTARPRLAEATMVCAGEGGAEKQGSSGRENRVNKARRRDDAEGSQEMPLAGTEYAGRQQRVVPGEEKTKEMRPSRQWASAADLVRGVRRSIREHAVPLQHALLC